MSNHGNNPFDAFDEGPDRKPETPDLDELRRAVEGATPGLWQAFEERYANGSAPDFGVRLPGRTEPFFVDDLEGAKANAAHIAAWCPANALAVLDLIADLRDRLAKAEAERDIAFVKGLQEAANIARRKARDDGQLWVLGEATASDSQLCAVTGCAIAERIEARAAALVAGQEAGHE